MHQLVSIPKKDLEAHYISFLYVFNQPEDGWLISWKSATCDISVFHEMGKGRRSPIDEVCAQKAKWRWYVWAQLTVYLECTAAKDHFTLSHYLELLTCCWVIDGHRNLLPLPTHNMGLWRRYRFCRKRMTMSYLGLLSKYCGLSNSQWGRVHTFYTSHVVRTGQGEPLSHR